VTDGAKTVLDYATQPKQPGPVGPRLAMAAIVSLGAGYGLMFFVLSGWTFLFYGHAWIETLIGGASPVSLLVAIILSGIAHRSKGVNQDRNAFVLLLAVMTLMVQLAALWVLSVC
jgi:hypothetical protein